jgi:hypothetical protein
MEVVAVFAFLLLVFAAIFWLLIRRVWLRYRVIALLVPRVGDPQTFNFKMTEAIRGLNFREDGQERERRVFRAPNWMKWVVGLQDISVEEAGGGAVLVTGPGFWVSSIGKSFTGVTMRQYQGSQPVWPLLKGCLRLMGGGVVALAATGFAVYVFGVR